MSDSEMTKAVDNMVKHFSIACFDMKKCFDGKDFEQEAMIYGFIALLFRLFPKAFLNASAELFDAIRNEEI